MHAHLDKRLQGRKREILAAIMYAIRPVCGTLAPPPPLSSLADYAWLWMARRGPGSQNRLPLDSMHVRYYTVFSVYLFHARRASAIRNYAWNMCPGTYGSRTFVDGFSSVPFLWRRRRRIDKFVRKNNWNLEWKCYFNILYIYYNI